MDARSLIALAPAPLRATLTQLLDRLDSIERRLAAMERKQAASGERALNLGR